MLIYEDEDILILYLVVFSKVEIGAALKLEKCQNILVGKSKQTEWI